MIYGCAFAQNKVDFSPEGGNYPGLKEIRVHIPKGWSVYYTRNGTKPNKNSKKVTKTISIHGDEALYFAIYKKDTLLPLYTSNTYITSRQQTLPYFSILTDPENLFDSLNGIYEMGCCASKKPPFKGANFWKDIEKPIHIEFIDQKKQVINQEAGIDIFGGYSKSMPQKSLAIYARKKYGDNRFRTPLFPQLHFKKYKNFILRNAGGDMQGAHIRDPFSSQLTKAWKLAYQEYRPVAVYINGKYWGIYGLREKINEHYIHNHFGIKKKNVSVLAPPDDIKYDSRNTLDEYQQLKTLLKNNTKLNNVAISKVQKIIDIEDYLKYSIVQIYFGNSDAARNIKLYKDAESNNPYRTILYDLDMGLSIFQSKKVKENSLALFTSTLDTNIQYPTDYTLLLRKLLTNDSIRSTFINYFVDALNTFFEPEYAIQLLNQMTEKWSNEIGYHRERWNVKEIRYETSIERIKEFLIHRPEYISKYLAHTFDLKEQFKLQFVHKKGGNIRLNSVVLSSDYSANYYKGIPLSYEALPADNYEFKGWKHQKSSNRKQFVTVQEEVYTIAPIFEPKPKPDYLKKVVLSEFKINHTNKSNTKDWIELLNVTNDTLDLSNWVLKDNQDTSIFKLKNGTLLLPKSYLILAENERMFKNTFGMFMNVVGDIPFGFINKDHIRLYDDNGYLLIDLDLSTLPKLKDLNHSWVRQSLRAAKKNQQQWRQEEPSPGDNRILFSKNKKVNNSNILFHSTLFYGIVLFLLILLVFFYYFGQRIDS